jgi:ribonuclease BN (tRNA processing enzyme)
MDLTILGNGPACPNKGGATSGYFVTQGNTRILVDCGTGVVSRLQEHADYHQMTAVVISHMHADHFLDLIPYRYGLKYASYDQSWQPPLLYLPPGGEAVLRQVVAPFSENPDFLADCFRVAEYDPYRLLSIGEFELRFVRTMHPKPAYAISLAAAEKRMVFSADSGPSEALAELARGADLLLAESAIMSRADDPNGTTHLTPVDAGTLAKQAGVKRLLLTHFWQEFDRSQLINAASDAYGAPVELAEEHHTYTI